MDKATPELRDVIMHIGNRMEIIQTMLSRLYYLDK